MTKAANPFRCSVTLREREVGLSAYCVMGKGRDGVLDS